MALINRPVRMPRRPEPFTPWTRAPAVVDRIRLEEPAMPDYPPSLLTEEGHKFLLETA